MNQIQLLNTLINTTDDNHLKSEAYYNLGNNFLKQQQIEDAINSYKEALRINPSDEQSRYNLSKALSLINEEDKEKNKDQKEQEKNKEKQKQNSGQTDNEDNEDERERKEKRW